MRRSSGKSSDGTRTHLLLTCGSRPDYAIMRQTVESYSWANGRGSQAVQPHERSTNEGQEGKEKGKGKHRGKHESSR